MALINQNSLIGITSITSPSASNVLTVHTNDTNERLRVTTDGLSFSGTNASLDTSGNLTVSGNVSVGGTLTYEDVTNIDSVGIITAQAGIHVTGGNIGIGTDNPSRKLHINAGSTDTAMLIESTDGDVQVNLKDSDSTDGVSIGADGDDFYVRKGLTTERLRITSDGYARLATANARLEWTASSGSNPFIRSIGSGQQSLEINTGGSERLRITSAGLVGIGTDTPSINDGTGLHIAGTSAGIKLQNLNNSDWAFIEYADESNTTKFIEGYRDASGLYAIRPGTSLNATPGISLNSSGSVGINEISPNRRLYISGSESTTYSDNSGSNNAYLRLHNKNGTDNSGVNNHVGIEMYVADGATTVGMLSMQRTGNNIGDFTYKTRTSASTYAEYFRITSAGRIGMGVDNPENTLHVKNASNAATTIRIQTGEASNDIANGDEYASIIFDGSSYTGAKIGSNRDDGTWNDRGDLRFYSGYGNNVFTERMRIRNTGQVNIGDDLGVNHSGEFQVINTAGGQQTNDCLTFFETNGNDWIMKLNSNEGGSASHYHMYFMEEGATRGSIFGSHGSNVNYNQGSDYRWKENIIDLTGTEGIDICKKLKPRKYNWIKNREGTGQINTVDGFIAHEVQEAGVLGAVTGEKDAVNEDGSIDGQMIDYGQMTPVLAAAIKGLIDKVETLETKVAALEG